MSLYKNKKIFIGSFFCLFGITNANISEDINQLFEDFFGNNNTEQTSASITPVEDWGVPTVEENISDAEIKKLEWEEEKKAYQSLQEKTAVISENFSDLGQKIETLNNELQSMQFDQKNLEKNRAFYARKVKKYREILEEIAREKSILQIYQRIKKEELDKLVLDQATTDIFSDTSGKVGLLYWIFSDESFHALQKKREERAIVLTQKRAEMQKINTLQEELIEREKATSDLYFKMYDLNENTNLGLLTFGRNIKGRSELVEKLRNKSLKTAEDLRLYQTEQARSLQYLQSLELEIGLSVTDAGKNQEPMGNFSLHFPLPIPMKISAGFRDPEYKVLFGIAHDGTDFSAPQGTPIYAPRAGEVIKTEDQGLGYSFIILKHDQDYYTVYGHVSEILVAEKSMVKTGDLIGKTGGAEGRPGSGSFTTGPHLHMELYRNGKYLDVISFFYRPVNV